ncbi:MAG: hypothetical protein AMDU4_FER2C00109G0001 [Ferroplasma sp. Type II]|nr:MAG: hypothetical protein AMDU4_FER2C00109G0001 [Ferroplasma sp. Type II]
MEEIEINGPNMSLGCNGSSDRYVSLKSMYLINSELRNAEKSGDDVPMPIILAFPGYSPIIFLTFDAGGESIDEYATPNASMNLRLTSCFTSSPIFS